MKIECDPGVLGPCSFIIEEEHGFRTVGWPRRMEEIGLNIDAWGGIDELGFYRSCRRSGVSEAKLRGHSIRAMSPAVSTA